MAKHFEYTYTGAINKTFKFSINSLSHADQFICVKDDGYLYITGTKITNNPESIKNIRDILRDANTSEETFYTEATFVTDSDGIFWCKKHIRANNRFSLLLQSWS